MRIVLHHRTQGQGVESVHLLGMARAFERAGASVMVVSPPGVEVGRAETPSSRGSGLRRVWWELAERVPELFFELMEIAYNVPAFFRLRRAVRAFGADALYERYAFFNIAGALAAKSAGIPLLLEMNFTTRTPLYRSRSRLLMPLARAAERFLLRRATLVAAVSTVLSDQVVDLGVARERVITVPNAADPSRFRSDISGAAIRARYGLDGARVIGFCGAFFPWHGVERILDVLPEVARRVPTAAVLLLGDGPQRPALEHRARADGMENRVRFAGWIGHERLPEHIAAFDVAVLPDTNEYGSPMKIYEYMAMGKPVVGPRLSPLEDGVLHGETGALFTARDTRALGDALCELLGDDARRAAMGERARAHVLANHTWDRNAERVLERFRALAPAPGGRPAGRDRT